MNDRTEIEGPLMLDGWMPYDADPPVDTAAAALEARQLAELRAQYGLPPTPPMPVGMALDASPPTPEEAQSAELRQQYGLPAKPALTHADLEARDRAKLREIYGLPPSE